MNMLRNIFEAKVLTIFVFTSLIFASISIELDNLHDSGKLQDSKDSYDFKDPHDSKDSHDSKNQHYSRNPRDSKEPQQPPLHDLHHPIPPGSIEAILQQGLENYKHTFYWKWTLLLYVLI